MPEDLQSIPLSLRRAKVEILERYLNQPSGTIISTVEYGDIIIMPVEDVDLANDDGCKGCLFLDEKHNIYGDINKKCCDCASCNAKYNVEGKETIYVQYISEE